MITLTTAKGVSTITIEGKFTFDSHQEFNTTVGTACTESSSIIRVSLGRVTYLDSAALGLLLIARDKATKCKKIIELSDVSGTVANVLEIANFKKIFRFV